MSIKKDYRTNWQNQWGDIRSSLKNGKLTVIKPPAKKKPTLT